MDSYFWQVMLAGLLTGVSTSLLGVYIVGLRIPFIGTCISHAAMAGVVWAPLIGIGNQAGGIAGAVLAACALACVDPQKRRVDINVALAILFSFLLGFTFLGVGLYEQSRNEVLGLLWGSLLLMDSSTLWGIGVMAALLCLFLAVFHRPLEVILFSRSIARSTGVHLGTVYFLFLLVTGFVLAVNLKTVGGLMLFSLITNPAAAAYQIAGGFKRAVVFSVFFGAFSATGGVLISWFTNLPTGACIVLLSSLVFGAAALYKSVFVQN